MTTHFAKAYPRKRFFLQMFTRDISLEECILDLIDNSIDGAIRDRQLSVEDFLKQGEMGVEPDSLPIISVKFSGHRFEIADQCGGISREDAANDTFNFGHAWNEDHKSAATLGAYGIGLKRAIFKIGRKFKMTSQTINEGFVVETDLEEWAQRDTKPDDWRFPLEYIAGAQSEKKAGTTIVITGLSDDAKHTFGDVGLERRLRKQVARTYSLFLDRYVQLQINNKRVTPIPIPFGESELVTPSVDHFVDNDVKVTVAAGFAAKDELGKWRDESAGWYVACNGRLVVIADKTELTGWTGKGGIMPLFQPQYRGFVGVVLFQSSNPLSLPWTTTKRSLNRDAPLYSRTKSKMQVVARPVIAALQRFYRREADETAEEREAAGQMTLGNIRDLAAKESSAFAVRKMKASERPTTKQINFRALIVEIDAIKSHLRRPNMSNSEVGRHAFDYFLDSEGVL